MALLLTGCATSNVSLESRSISLNEEAEPAGALPQGYSQAIVNQTGPTYVTLTVASVSDKFALNKNGQTKRPVTSGSGFIVDQAGIVMTAAHVAVATGNSVSARAADGRIYSGTVVATYPDHDIAVLKLRGYRGLSVSPVSDSCLATGRTVFSLGKPHAQGDTARFGVLQAKNFGRAVQYGKFGYPDAMVVQMATQKGESGGPLFNQDGKLTGMIVSTLSDGNGRPLNMAHAIPSTQLAKYLCQTVNCAQSWGAIARGTPANCSAS